MNQQPARRSSLFLMELIVAILFFSLAAAVCVRLFVKSHTLEQDSVSLTHAVNAASSAADIFRSQNDVYSFLKEQFPKGEKTETGYAYYYDEHWKLCSASEGCFTVQFSTADASDLLKGTITVTKGNELLYELTVQKYIPKEAF